MESLHPGDRVVTRDNGLKRIVWTGRRVFSYADLVFERQLRPILVRAGALGEGRPAQNMIVSPNHRFLLDPSNSERVGGEGETLVAARHLVDGRSILFADMLGVSYIHFLCSAHEVVLADGAWTESFHPDDQILLGLGPAQRDEILSLFPEIATMGAARRFPSVRPIRKSRFET